LKVLPISTTVEKDKFSLFENLKSSDFKYKENDILAISSKYVAISEGSVINLSKVKVGKEANILASQYHMDAKLAEITLRESDYIFKGVPGFLLAVSNGMLAPNAGIDKSNIPPGFVVLYPRDPFRSAETLRVKFLIEYGIRIGVLITDSRLMPTRIGTVGIAIACSGFEPVEDQRGKKDLFGKVLRVTLKAIADSLATMAVAAMGESDESTPAAIIRDTGISATNRKLSWYDMAIDTEQDIYIGGSKSLKCFPQKVRYNDRAF